MSEKIITCLRNNSLSTKEFDSRFISWCRNSFVLQDIGVRIFLCDIKTGKPVLLYENMYDIFKKIHYETAHAGRDKCLDNLSINYSWYNRDLLQIFLKNCSSCQKRKSIKRPVVSKPIIALGEIYYFNIFCRHKIQRKKMDKTNHISLDKIFPFSMLDENVQKRDDSLH